MMQIFKSLKFDGEVQGNHSAVAKFCEKLAHMDNRKDK